MHWWNNILAVFSRFADAARRPANEKGPSPPSGKTVLSVAEAPPKTAGLLTAQTVYRRLRRTLAIRHISDHRLVAVVEIASPANKDRLSSVREFVDKVVELLQHGVHVLLVDVVRPECYDRYKLHACVWEAVAGETYRSGKKRPLTLASYVAAEPVRTYVEHIAVGEALPDMPIFLTSEHYVLAPLEKTYTDAWSGLPTFWQKRLSKGWHK